MPPLSLAGEYCHQTLSLEDEGKRGGEVPLPLPQAGEGWGEGYQLGEQ